MDFDRNSFPPFNFQSTESDELGRSYFTEFSQFLPAASSFLVRQSPFLPPFLEKSSKRVSNPAVLIIWWLFWLYRWLLIMCYITVFLYFIPLVNRNWGQYIEADIRNFPVMTEWTTRLIRYYMAIELYCKKKYHTTQHTLALAVVLFAAQYCVEVSVC